MLNSSSSYSNAVFDSTNDNCEREILEEAVTKETLVDKETKRGPEIVAYVDVDKQKIKDLVFKLAESLAVNSGNVDEVICIIRAERRLLSFESKTIKSAVSELLEFAVNGTVGARASAMLVSVLCQEIDEKKFVILVSNTSNDIFHRCRSMKHSDNSIAQGLCMFNAQLIRNLGDRQLIWGLRRLASSFLHVAEFMLITGFVENMRCAVEAFEIAGQYLARYDQKGVNFLSDLLQRKAVKKWRNSGVISLFFQMWQVQFDWKRCVCDAQWNNLFDT